MHWSDVWAGRQLHTQLRNFGEEMKGGRGAKFPQTSPPEAQGQIDGKREETAQFSMGALNSTQNFRAGSPTTTPKPETPPQLPNGAGGRSTARQHPTAPRFQ